MANILLAEDSASIREAITALLESEFHTVVSLDDGARAFETYIETRPDLVILDVMMPHKNGLDVCREIRRVNQRTPILFLSAKGSETDKVLGLGIGADDYMVKPFGTNEFLARIGALIRRASLSFTETMNNDAECFRLGDTIVSCKNRMMFVDKKTQVSLTCRECMLLKLFYQSNAQIVPKEKILETLWGELNEPRSRSLDQHICNLRKKLSCHGFVFVTIPRQGVKLEFTCR